jgi:sigma-E factor negative regulatory protein RseC
MVEEHGVVVEVSDHYAWVKTQRQSSCGQCGASKGCGTASLAQVLGQKYNEIRVVNHLNVKVGDQVVIGLEEQALVRSSLLLYLLPLLTMFIAAVALELLGQAWQWPSSELYTMGAGLVGLLFGLAGVLVWSRRLADNSHYQPVLLKTDTVPSDLPIYPA